jgi:hypothetical protein
MQDALSHHAGDTCNQNADTQIRNVKRLE